LGQPRNKKTSLKLTDAYNMMEKALSEPDYI